MGKIEHPGFELQRLIDSYHLSNEEVAAYLGLDYDRIRKVTRAELPISPELALLVGQAFYSPEYWTYRQGMYDLVRKRDKMKAEGRLPVIVPYDRPTRDPSAPTIFDECLCGHWGWEHIDYPEGGCSAVKEDGTPCSCPLYLRLGAYLATVKAESGISLNEEATPPNAAQWSDTTKRDDDSVP